MTIPTPDRLLDAAECCFAEQGFAATSLRAVTQAAGANLAAVNYHFGSKEGLIAAVLRRRVAPMNAERLALLDAAGTRPGLEQVLLAFARPPLALAATPRGPVITRMMARVFADPERHLRLAEEHFLQLRVRFRSALAACLPGLDDEHLDWAMTFLLGSLIHTLLGAQVLDRISAGRCRVGDVDAVLDHFIAYHGAALRALDRTG